MKIMYTLLGLEQRMKHADVAAAAADAKIASLTIEGSKKQQQPGGENLPDEIKELKAQVSDKIQQST